MLKLLTGRAGTGKTTKLLQEMTSRQVPSILLVPEQASHDMERMICQVGGAGVSLYGEVLSFSRLANRVFSQPEVGGIATTTLDAGGRILLMCAALKKASAQLTVYQKPSKKPAFLTGLLATLDECKQYQVSPQQMSEVGETLEDGEGAKLRDLALIFGAYEALCAQTSADPRDNLTRLAEGLQLGQYAKDMEIYVDGFTDFTPQQGLVLRALLRQAKSVTVALTCGDLAGEEPIFAPARRTARYLMQLAERERVPVEPIYLTQVMAEKSPDLSDLEEALFHPDPPCKAETAPAFTLYRADSPRSEAEWIASQMLRLCRQEGYRFRDIAVVGRSFDSYAPLVDEVFRRYGIPVFLDGMTDILQKPVFGVVTGALDTVAGGYRYDDVFRYLKTGLTDLSRDQVDTLENYVLKWNIKGSAWTQKADWKMHPKGYGAPLKEEDKHQLTQLNDARKQMVAPLERLRSNKAETGRGQAVALYGFLEDIGLAQQLEHRAQRLQAQGNLQQAEEEGQLWDILCGGLTQCAQLLADAPVTLAEFAQLLKLVLSQYEVGSIPVSLDRVTAGELARLGNKQVKALFLLGADDGALPQVAPSAGLFTDEDRDVLADFGLSLSPRLSDKLDREMTMVYEACTRPSQYLTVSWSSKGSQGEDKRPSFLVERCKQLFPHNPVQEEADTRGDFRLSAPKPALELAGHRPEVAQVLAQLPDYAPLVQRIQESAQNSRGRLSPQAVSQLYGQRVPMSASRMDKYKSCHFAYFMQYGLKAKARQVAGFQAPEYGSFVHYILEHILQDKEFCQAFTYQELQTRIQSLMEVYLEEELGGTAQKTPRFLYLFQRLLRPVTQVVLNLLDELAHSQFQPMAFELGFGSQGDLPPVELTVGGMTVSISGFVDRVDGWVKDGRLYLRVVDYKTGRKSFDFTEIWNGLGLQMLLYLFTLEEKGQSYFGQESQSAGVLYLPAREVTLQASRGLSQEGWQKEVDKELKRQGIVLDQPAVLSAMEEPEDGNLRFLPLKINKKGEISGDALVSLEQLGKLKSHTQRILQDIAQELAAGNISADPYWRGTDKQACQYCDYATACHFREGKGGDCWRYLPKLKSQEFWANLSEGEEDV